MLAANATRTEKLKLMVIRSSINSNALVYLNYDALSMKLEGEKSDKEVHTSSSKTIYRGRDCLRLIADNINKQKEQNFSRRRGRKHEHGHRCGRECSHEYGHRHSHEYDCKCGCGQRQASQNSKEKTEILFLLSDTEIDNTIFAIQDLTELKKDDVDELIIDLTTNLSDLTIECQLNKFNKFEKSDANDTDVLLPKISIFEGLDSLKNLSVFLNSKKAVISM
ncbi:13359_t:CDS:2 [Racocetra fulgida]|uniref:13359_t:CDS:1 n=1 Tax=Racocetra fulgida TaxID=60492 RepID=A0A9N8VXK0_9GLOM|nr:13359_t:CDS:2 [Racocetra fulgida]